MEQARRPPSLTFWNRASSAQVIASAATSRSLADSSPSTSARPHAALMRFKSRSPGRSTSTSAELSAPNGGPRSGKICLQRRRRWRWNWAAIQKRAAWRPNEGQGLEGAPETRCCTAAQPSAAHKSQRAWERAKKGGRHVATAALSLGRKRPRRAYAAGHAAPQQYRWSSPSLQVFSSSNGQSLTEFGAVWHSGQDLAIAIQTRINSYS